MSVQKDKKTKHEFSEAVSNEPPLEYMTEAEAEESSKALIRSLWGALLFLACLRLLSEFY